MKRQETKWDQVIVSACGIVDRPDEIVSELLRHRDPYLAAMCIASGANISSEIVETTVRKLLVDEMQAFWTTEERIGLVCKTLAEIGQPAVPALLDFISDENSDIARTTYVVEILGRSGDASAVPALRRLLKELDDSKSVEFPHPPSRIRRRPSLASVLASVDYRDTAVNVGKTAAKLAAVTAVGVVLAPIIRDRTPPWLETTWNNPMVREPRALPLFTRLPTR